MPGDFGMGVHYFRVPKLKSESSDCGEIRGRVWFGTKLPAEFRKRMGHPTEYSENLPSHYCENCTHVAFVTETTCRECGSEKPAGGWASIQDGADRWLGRVFDGRYVITRRVGRGAMGAVYRATSLAISRQFAIKVINFREGSAGIDAEQIRARLHREIDAIGRLRNPHIVPFYEVIELYDSFVGVVMDYVPGETLEALVERDGALSAKRAVAVLRQISNGIHEAHEMGMIHRDLKPDNIMVEKMPAGDDFAHVLDFGIVQMDDGVAMTRGFLGTPLYASPEQAMGGALDRRSDIYSLGAVLFYLLTGRPPFISNSVYEILQAHVRKAPPTLSEANASIHYPDRLEALVGEMLSKNPAKRPQSLAQVIKRLDALRESGELDEFAPDSIEFDLFDDTGQYSVRTTGSIALGEDSSSVFESHEGDGTGPKAAIFNRGPSRGTIRRMIDQEKSSKTQFDRVFEGNTGAHTLGIDMPRAVVRGQTSPDGDLVLAHPGGGISVIRGGQPLAIPTEAPATCVAIASGVVGYGDASGNVTILEEADFLPVLSDPYASSVTALALQTDGPWFAGFASGDLYLRKHRDAVTRWEQIQRGPAITAIAARNNGLFAVARKHGEVEVCSIASPRAPYQRIAVGGAVRALTLSDDGHLVAAVMEDETIVVHLVEGGKRVHALLDKRNRIFALRFASGDLVGYFRKDDKLYMRQLDREL